MGERTAIVTGGARGLGFAVAQALAADGVRVAIIDRSGATEAVGRLGQAHRGYHCDLSDLAATLAGVDDIAAQMGPPNILVHCAGLYPTTPIDELSLQLWREIFAVNVDAAAFLAKAMAPAMRTNGWGRIVMIASGTIAVVRRDVSAYIASKMALIGLTRALATDLGPDGVTVNAVAPGFVITDGTRAKFSDLPALEASIARKQAIPRLGVPAEIAATVAFLCSDRAAMVTGQTWMADGGWSRL